MYANVCTHTQIHTHTHTHTHTNYNMYGRNGLFIIYAKHLISRIYYSGNMMRNGNWNLCRYICI